MPVSAFVLKKQRPVARNEWLAFGVIRADHEIYNSWDIFLKQCQKLYNPFTVLFHTVWDSRKLICSCGVHRRLDPANRSQHKNLLW